jgi:hypothetical protein
MPTSAKIKVAVVTPLTSAVSRRIDDRLYNSPIYKNGIEKSELAAVLLFMPAKIALDVNSVYRSASSLISIVARARRSHV